MKRSKWIVVLILCIWFAISFVTNILGPIMPSIIDTFHLSLTMASFLPFSFFLAYAVMAVPAGILIEKMGASLTMLISFGITFTGAIVFALFPIYGAALASLFLIGMGMAMLQVIINPLMRIAGGEEHFAFNSVLAQLVFGIASFLSPFVFTRFMAALNSSKGNDFFLVGLMDKIVSPDVRWSGLYWIFSFLFLLLFIVILFVKIPKVEFKEEEKGGSLASYVYLLKKRQVLLYFFGIMAYVGTEQGLANWMSQFLSIYHGIDPLKDGAGVVALFWGLMSVGCLAGLIVLKLIDSRKVLTAASLLAVLSVLLAVFGSKNLTLLAFPFCGFCISVIFSIVFSLALNSEKFYHGSYSGILCSGIFGGALVPFIIGMLGDLFTLRFAMIFLLLPLGYLIYIAIMARPLINNKTITIRELLNTY